mgnify:CR=1 FL=1|jgi:hypothetical protein
MPGRWRVSACSRPFVETILLLTVTLRTTPAQLPCKVSLTQPLYGRSRIELRFDEHASSLCVATGVAINVYSKTHPRQTATADVLCWNL